MALDETVLGKGRHLIQGKVPKIASPSLSDQEAKNALVWFRSDLRTVDNPALTEASLCCAKLREQNYNASVIGLYLIHPLDWKRHFVSVSQVDLILRTLQDLRQTLLQQFQIPLFVMLLEEESLSYSFNTLDSDLYGGYQHDPNRIASHLVTLKKNRESLALWMKQYCQQLNISSIFYNKEYPDDGRKRDEIMEDILGKDEGILFHSYADQCLLQPGLVLAKSTGKPFAIFTPFKKSWLSTLSTSFDKYVNELTKPMPNCTLSEKLDLGLIPSTLEGYNLDAKVLHNTRASWKSVESDILNIMKKFVTGTQITSYKADRNNLELEVGTSRLSAYLSIGSLNVRTVVREIFLAFPDLLLYIRKYLSSNSSDMEKGPLTFLIQLCWRDFYRHILYFFPKISRGEPFQPVARTLAWRTGPEALKDFEAWKLGKTGFPIVDAGMRQLLATGWMHNRLRMIVASFLTKDLLIDWRWGERYFSEILIDGDIANNNGGWQWSASTGTDSQPYFRIFNPLLQGSRFDPNAVFIRRWVPELAKITVAKIARDPFSSLSSDDFEKLGYPKPIVNRAASRRLSIEMFKKNLASH